MATAYISVGASATTANSGQAPVLGSAPTSSETVTTSGTSAATATPATITGVASIFCETAVYVRAAQSGAVSASNGWFIPGGIPTQIAVSAGDYIHVIDA